MKIVLLLLVGCNYSYKVKECPSTLGKWSRLPIVVAPEQELLDPSIKAVEIWNSVVGREIFIISFEGINIKYGEVQNKYQEAITYIYLDGLYITGGYININKSINPDITSLLIHELGHLLGLDHSDKGQENTMSENLPIDIKRQFIDRWSRDKFSCLYKE